MNSAVQNTSTTLTLDCDTVLNLLTSDSIKLTYLGATPVVTGIRGLLKRTDNTTITDNVPVVVCVQSGNGSADMAVTLTVTNDCSTISAPAVNFDSAPLVQNFKSVSQSIAITCTKGSTYTVGVSNGSNATGNVRRMKSGNNYMNYEIYKSNGTNRWGSLGTERWASAASSGLSSDGLLRNFNYVAKVLTSQPTPPAGAYTDTLVVDVAF